ncbi:MAG: hypothetical protein ACT4PU_05650 [Planctomycetota bacterium]
MNRPGSRLPRPSAAVLAVLRAALALVVLLGTTSAHELLHGHSSEPGSGVLEVHGSDCEHEPESAPHDSRTCLQCKSGRHEALAAGNVLGTGLLVPSASRIVPSTSLDRPSSLQVSGPLGARAPPTLG